MAIRATYRRALAIALVIGAATTLSACGSKEPPAPTTSPGAATPAAGQPTAPPVDAGTQAATPTTWNAEALEGLLAPIALYPDPVLSQVLIASTNPQEVLDAGNWLLQNKELKATPLDNAAAAVGRRDSAR